MNQTIFDAIGPIMIGPSSSHTAGVAKLAKCAMEIVGGDFTKVTFGLHGSLSKTCKGHGTDKALLAGVMGFSEQDERIIDSYDYAEKAAFTYAFYQVELDNVHENTVLFTFTLSDGSTHTIIGSSIGGGQMKITKIDAFEVDITGKYDTLLLVHNDEPRMLNRITDVLATHTTNIAAVRLSRKDKGAYALSVIEVDDVLPQALRGEFLNIKGVSTAMLLNFH